MKLSEDVLTSCMVSVYARYNNFLMLLRTNMQDAYLEEVYTYKIIGENIRSIFRTY